MYFPDRGCLRTLRTLYVYATGTSDKKMQLLLLSMFRVSTSVKHMLVTVLPPMSALSVSLWLIGTVRAKPETVISQAWVQSPDPAE